MSADIEQVKLLRAEVKRQELTTWFNDVDNRRKYLAPLAMRILEKNPGWSVMRIVHEAKARGCSKTVAREINGAMQMVPNPDYVEPPLDNN